MLHNLPSNCPSLMEPPSNIPPSLEIPHFSAHDRWWEEYATITLMAYDLTPIQQGLRFGFLRDMEFVKYMLGCRPPQVLNSFLNALSKPDEHPSLFQLSNCEKVREILLRSLPVPPTLISWRWFPPAPGDLSSAQRIALEIEAESHFQFRQIAFEDIVRAALGYESPAVEWFLRQHKRLEVLLLKHMRAYPKEIPLYSMVEKHLRQFSPLAHQTISQCLMHIQSKEKDNLCLSASPSLAFLIHPVQQLFNEGPCNMVEMFERLTVLGVHFRKTYTHASRMSWDLYLDTSLPHTSSGPEPLRL